MSTIKEIQQIKQKYNLEDFDIWCIKYQLSEICNDDYNHIPNDVIKKIINNKELSIFLNNF